MGLAARLHSLQRGAQSLDGRAGRNGCEAEGNCSRWQSELCRRQLFVAIGSRHRGWREQQQGPQLAPCASPGSTGALRMERHCPANSTRATIRARSLDPSFKSVPAQTLLPLLSIPLHLRLLLLPHRIRSIAFANPSPPPTHYPSPCLTAPSRTESSPSCVPPARLSAAETGAKPIADLGPSQDNTAAPKQDQVLPLFSLKGKTAIVSGAGAGIGLAVAQGFAEAGANVAIWYNSNKKAIERAEEIEKKYGVKCKSRPSQHRHGPPGLT